MKYAELLAKAKELYGADAVIEAYSRDDGVTWGARLFKSSADDLPWEDDYGSVSKEAAYRVLSDCIKFTP